MDDKHLAGIRERKKRRAEKYGDGESAKSLLLSALTAIRVILKQSKENATIPESDRVALEFLATGLDKFSSGESLESALCLAKYTGRPTKKHVEYLLDYALPVGKLVDDGIPVVDAIKEVAKKIGVSTRTVKRGWNLSQHPKTEATQGVVEIVETDKK